MYLWIIALLTGALPVLSIIVEHVLSGLQTGLLFLIGKRFVLRAAGVRLFSAGLRQAARPGCTAEILRISDPSPTPSRPHLYSID